MSERWEIIWCPICGREIHRHDASAIQGRARVSSRVANGGDLLTQMVREADAIHRQQVKAAENACAEHFRTRHAWRLRLWKRTRWGWVMRGRWPWSRPAELEDFRVAV